MDRCAVFIDGGYLEKILKQKGKPKIDYKKLSEKLSDGMNLVRTYYYDGKPYQSHPPTDDEREFTRNKDRFFNCLRNLPRFEVRLGRMVPKTVGGKVTFKQKEVDVMLAVDLVKMSWDKQIQMAVIVTGDSDYAYAVQEARNTGVITKICYSNKVHVNRCLLDVFDEKMLLTQDILDDCLLHPS